MAEYDKNAE